MRTEEEGFTNVVVEWFLGGSLAVNACMASQRLGPVLPARARSPPPSPQRSSPPNSPPDYSQQEPPAVLPPSSPGAGMGSPVVGGVDSSTFASTASFSASASALVAASESTAHDYQHDEQYDDEYRRDGVVEEQQHEHEGRYDERARGYDEMDTVYEGTQNSERSEWSHDDDIGRGYEHDGDEGGAPAKFKSDGACYDHIDSAAVVATTTVETEAEMEKVMQTETVTGTSTDTGGGAMDMDMGSTENAWLFEHHHGAAFTDD